MKVLDLFSGIGGFSLGLQNAGFKPSMFCETDKFCQAVLRKHWPHVPCHDDIRTLKIKDDMNFDVVCGGFPCQDISSAGRREGIGGERSGLWKEFKRIIKEARPNYAIIENVANLRSQGLITVLQDISSIGYNAEWQIISAAQVGAPHLRERIWIVAYPNGTGRPEVTYRTHGDERKDEPHHNIFTHGFLQSLQLATADSAGKCLEGTEWKEPPNKEYPGLGYGCYWKETVAPLCGVDVRLPFGMDRSHNSRGLKATLEYERKDRVKALGNSLVPQIAELIGRKIAYFAQ